jgi:hypothetical protein
LRRYKHEERDRFVGPSSYSTGEERRFTIMASHIVIAPDARASGDYRFWYVPKWTDLSSSVQAIPAPMEQWAEYIAVDAAIKCLLKEESDASALMMRKAELGRRIENGAQNRDASEQDFIGSSYWSWT